MLRYRDHEWLVRHGPTRFEVYIAANHRKPKDVMWSMELHYIAAGAQWRRVQESHRPSVQLSLNSWKHSGKSWTDLENCDFSDPDKDVNPEEAWMPLCFRSKAGELWLHYQPEPKQKAEPLSRMIANWKVRERDGHRFLVELAATPGEILMPEEVEEEVLVLPDGTEEAAQDDEHDPADFWKVYSTIYVMEEVPFGKVTVRVPRNAKSHLDYARKRARDLLGVTAPPESYEIKDFLEAMPQGEEDEPRANAMHDDVYVKMHFHSYYNDE